MRDDVNGDGEECKEDKEEVEKDNKDDIVDEEVKAMEGCEKKKHICKFYFEKVA